MSTTATENAPATLARNGKPAASAASLQTLRELADQVNGINQDRVGRGEPERFGREKTEAYTLLRGAREGGHVISQAQASFHIDRLIRCVRTLRGDQPAGTGHAGQPAPRADAQAPPAAGPVRRGAGQPVVDDADTTRYHTLSVDLYGDFAASRNQIGRLQQLAADGFGGSELVEALENGISKPEARVRITQLKLLEAEAARRGRSQHRSAA